MSKKKTVAQRLVDGEFNNFAEFDEAKRLEEQEPAKESCGGAEIMVTEGQLGEIISNAVKAALEADQKRREDESRLSIAAKAARRHCDKMNGEGDYSVDRFKA